MLRVAIIGAGRIGRVHAESVASHPKATLVAVCDPMGTAAEDLAAIYGAKAYKDAADVFADTEVDAVIVGSPTPLHAEHVLGATRSGKAVLVEKPVAKDVEEARALDAERAGRDRRAGPIGSPGVLRRGLGRSVQGHEHPRLRRGPLLPG